MDSKVNKHTPGPWYPGHLGNEKTSCECRTIVDEGHAGGVATVHMDNGILSIDDGGNDAPSKEQAIANMHLIAAAPDLLDSVDMVWELLEDLEGYYEDQDRDLFWETLAVIRTNYRWVRKKARNEL